MAQNYLNLAKPGIIVLLLITTACPMVLAGGGQFSFQVFLLTMLGGALVSASASTLNCVFDRDIDAIMKRTKHRSIPAGKVSVGSAVAFALFTGLLGLVTLAVFLNPLAAILALSGHLFYVFVYTIWLKRSSPQNIVIGGAAGAVPPLVAWAAVTGEVSLSAFLMFLIVFLWTPPHFWALALNKNEDYKKAGVPMMPLVVGKKSTSWQMLLYSLALLPVSLGLTLSDEHLGLFSQVSLLGLSAWFSYLNLKLFSSFSVSSSSDEGQVESAEKEEEDKVREKLAWKVFNFSLIYLALFFVVIVLDSSLL